MHSLSLSLVCYADAVFMPSRTIMPEKNFEMLKDKYPKMGLDFKEAKSEVVLFNC